MRVSAPPLLHATQPLHWVCCANRNPICTLRTAQRCAHQLSREAMFASFFADFKKSMLSICSGSLRSGHGPVYIKSRPITAPHRGSELTAKVCPKEQKMKSGGGGGANVKLIFHRFLGLVQIWLRPAALHSQAPAQSPRGGSRLRESRRSQVAGRRSQSQHLSASSGEFRESPAPAAQLRE